MSDNIWDFMGVVKKTYYNENLYLGIESKNYLWLNDEIVKNIEYMLPYMRQSFLLCERICLSKVNFTAKRIKILEQFLKYLPNVKEVQFKHLHITNFNKLTFLQSVDLRSIAVNMCEIDSMYGIDAFQNLEHICFNSSNFFETKSIELLSNLPNLKIFQSYIVKYSNLNFIESMKSLEQLYIIGMGSGIDKINTLNNLSKLQVLLLLDGGEFKADISKLKNLEYLDLGNPHIVFVDCDRPKINLDILKNLPNIKGVNIELKDISDITQIEKYSNILNNNIDFPPLR